MLSFCHRTVKFVFPSSPQKIARNMGLHAHCGRLQIVRRPSDDLQPVLKELVETDCSKPSLEKRSRIVRRSRTIPLPEPSSLTNL
jgi:hypothetical protein